MRFTHRSASVTIAAALYAFALSPSLAQNNAPMADDDPMMDADMMADDDMMSDGDMMPRDDDMMPREEMKTDDAGPDGDDAMLADETMSGECEVPSIGEFASFTVSEGDDQRVTRVELEFQCGDTLSDGTYIPTGYRMYLEGDCGEAGCDYPTIMMLPTARDSQWEAFTVSDGKNVNARLRGNRRRGLSLTLNMRAPGRGQERERASYRLTPEQDS